MTEVGWGEGEGGGDWWCEKNIRQISACGSILHGLNKIRSILFMRPPNLCHTIEIKWFRKNQNVHSVSSADASIYYGRLYLLNNVFDLFKKNILLY